jgi:hypothetical protein
MGRSPLGLMCRTWCGSVLQVHLALCKAASYCGWHNLQGECTLKMWGPTPACSSAAALLLHLECRHCTTHGAAQQVLQAAITTVEPRKRAAPSAGAADTLGMVTAVACKTVLGCGPYHAHRKSHCISCPIAHLDACAVVKDVP